MAGPGPIFGSECMVTLTGGQFAGIYDQPTAATSNNILQEDGWAILQENGDFILQE